MSGKAPTRTAMLQIVPKMLEKAVFAVLISFAAVYTTDTTSPIDGAFLANAAGTVTEVKNGLELALFFLNNTADRAVVATSYIGLSEEAFDKAGRLLGVAEFPVLVTRSVTITSLPAFGQMWPEVDLMYMRHKLRLGNGVWVRCNRVVISHFRADNPTRVPGLDIFAPTQSPSLAFLIMDQAAIVHPACYPTSIGAQNVAAMVRPPVIPGEQVRLWDIPQTGCIPRGSGSGNSAWVSRMAQCYGIINLDIDVATYGADMDPATSKPVSNNQILAGRNQTNLCEVLLTLDCVQRLGPLGCYLTTVGPRSNGSNVASTGATTNGSGSGVKELTASPVDSGDSGDGDSNTTLIAALCGSLIGAAVLLALVVGAAMLVRRRRLRSRQQKGGGPASAGELALGADGSKGASALGPTAAGLQSGRGSGGGSEDTSRGGSGSAEEAVHPPDVEAACGALVGPLQDGGATLPTVAACAVGSGAVGTDSRVVTVLPAPTSGASGTGASDATSMSAVFAVAPTSEQQAPVTTFTPRRADLHMNVRMVASGHSAFSRFSRGNNSSAAASGGPREAGAAAGATTGSSVAVDSTDSDAPAAEAGRALSEGAAAADTNEVELLPVLLGKGAFGQVVEGIFRGQRVAVKLLSDYNILLQDVADGGGPDEGGEGDKGGRPAAPQPFTLRSFADEVEVLSRVDHPNVVRLLGACLDPPRICLVMERMQTSLYHLLHHTGALRGSEEAQAAAAGGGSGSGGTTIPANLCSTQQGTPPMPVCKALHIALGVARGLEYLHPTVLHRDLKPANVLLNNPDSNTPEVKITDFGISRLNHATLVTQRPGAGTPAYLAPECYEAASLKRGAITHRADMYSFGILMWELLSGFKPWQGYGLVDLAAAVVVHRQRPPLDAIDRGHGGIRCPALVRGLVAQCWEHDPLRRPAAAEAVKCLEMALQELAGGGLRSAGLGSGLAQPGPTSSAASTPRAGAAAADTAAQAPVLSVEQLEGPLQAPLLPRPLGTAPAGEEWFVGGMTDFSTRTGVPGLASVLGTLDNTAGGQQPGTHWTLGSGSHGPGATEGAGTWAPGAVQGQSAGFAAGAGAARLPIRFAVRVWSPAT